MISGQFPIQCKKKRKEKKQPGENKLNLKVRLHEVSAVSLQSKYFGSQLTPPQNGRCHQEHAAQVKEVFLIKLPSLPTIHPRPRRLSLVQLNEISDICLAESRSKSTDEKRIVRSTTPGRSRIFDVFHLRCCGHELRVASLQARLCRRRRRPDTYIFIRPRMAELWLHNQWGQAAALCFSIHSAWPGHC